MFKIIKIIENFFLKIYRKIQSKTIYKNNFKTPEFYDYYFSKNEEKQIIQVGGNDGIQSDPLRIYLKVKGNYNVIIFEPINFYYQKLKKLYSRRNDVLIKKFYVSNDDDIKKIYFIKPEICEDYFVDKKNDWLHGLGSFDKKNVENAINQSKFREVELKKNIEKLKNNIISEEVSPFKLKNLNFSKNTLNLLVIDVQGFELEVLSSLSFNEKVDYIVYEDEFPYSEKSKKIRKLLNMNNYELIGRLTWLDQIYKKRK